MDLQDNIHVVRGIGEKTEKLFAKLNIYTIKDLLEHYPRDYDIYKNAIPINELTEGKTGVIDAKVVKEVQVTKVRNLQIIRCTVKDNVSSIDLIWFNMLFLKSQLQVGNQFIFRGKAVKQNGILVMKQPEILLKQVFLEKLNVLQPIYPLTAGVTNYTITKAIKQVFSQVNLENDLIPRLICKQEDLINYKEALYGIHFPKNKEHMLKARRRIVFEEFFWFCISINQMKKEKIKKSSQFILSQKPECETYIQKLPYQLTTAQKKVLEEIQHDLSSSYLMNRLIQGDVGSGKTVLAAIALLQVALNGCQGCFMVPTEVLAKQHYEMIKEDFEKFGVKTILLVGSMTAKEKTIAYDIIQKQEADIIVGTHALIQEKVKYKNLALVITDEQHRFGVKQREALSAKGNEPHVLVMSATPIPRTLAIILYGDLDVSIIDQLPANRLPIKNCVVDTGYRKTAYQFIQNQVEQGRQAYVICPMVEESETIEAENVLEYTEKLKSVLSSCVQTEYLHGKMKAKEKNDIMERFISGEIQVLVSTTVVEVGVNVPNATVMMVENAERFGLAQLHQLRGRVGRGSAQSYCILISASHGKETKERLEILNHSNDGFYIANQDLKLRGPGDLFGIRQSGSLEFKMGDIYNDASILIAANEAAKRFCEIDPEILIEQYPELKNRLNQYTGNILL